MKKAAKVKKRKSDEEKSKVAGNKPKKKAKTNGERYL